MVKLAEKVSVKFENPPNSKTIFLAVVTFEIVLLLFSNLVSSDAFTITPEEFEEEISKNTSLFKVSKLL